MRPAGRRGAFKAKLRRRPPCAANGAKRLFGSTLAKKQFFSKMKQAVRLEKTGGPFYTGNIGVAAVRRTEGNTMAEKLRNMTAVYLFREGKLLMLYRVGSRVVAPSWSA